MKIDTPFSGGYGYRFLAFFSAFLRLAHIARAPLRARPARSAADIPSAALVPPAVPRHAGQYSTITNSVSGCIVQCFAIVASRYHW